MQNYLTLALLFVSFLFSSAKGIAATPPSQSNPSANLSSVVHQKQPNRIKTRPRTKPHTKIPEVKRGEVVLSNAKSINANDIIVYTNQNRTAHNLASLKQNNVLTAIAEARLNDMVSNGYFAHKSPGGEDAVTESQAKGYDYSFLGENLASGDFATSNDIVSAWMNSPGHRANILNKDYTEIGVATWYGEYMGRKQWLAVQIFGRPLL